MDALRNNGGASAPPTVLPFPQTARALRRRRTGMSASGYLSLLLMEREGEAIPVNVVRFDEPDGVMLPTKSPELLMLLLIFSQLPSAKQDHIKKTIRCMAYDGRPDAIWVQLNNVLNRRS